MAAGCARPPTPRNTLTYDAPTLRRPLFPAIALPPAAFAAAVIAWTLALHVPDLGKRGGDDPFFIEVARLWLHGAPPYLSAFDVKPPGYFLLLALSELVFGPTQTAVNALTIVSEAGAALLLWRLGRQLGLASAGAFAALAYPYLSQTLSNNPGYPPLALVTIGGYVLATGAGPWGRRALLSCLALGFAATIKQSACLEALPLLWLLGRERPADKPSLAPLLALAAAPLGFAMLFAAQGAFAPFFADVVVTALRRPGIEAETAGDIVRHFVSLQKMVLPLTALALFGLARLSTLPMATGRAEALALWLGVSWAELLLQHARWALYLGPTFAPLLLLSGAAITAAFQAEGSRRLAMGFALIATLVQVYPYRYWPLLGDVDAPVYRQAAEIVRARAPLRDDRLLGVGLLETAEVNTDAGVAPPSRYFYWLHLACDFPGAGPQRLREALESSPRFLVVATRPYHPYCEDPAVWPLVEATLASRYRRIGDAGKLVIYEREAAR